MEIACKLQYFGIPNDCLHLEIAHTKASFQNAIRFGKYNQHSLGLTFYSSPSSFKLLQQHTFIITFINPLNNFSTDSSLKAGLMLNGILVGSFWQQVVED